MLIISGHETINARSVHRSRIPMTVYRLQGRIPKVHPESWIASNATIIGSVEVKRNASLWWNTVARGDNDAITIGENSNVQDGAVLHTDAGIALTIGANCTIGHMVMLHGCAIGDGSLVGIGSAILNRARIGRHSIVGANSLVTEGKTFPDGVLIVGSPARVARELTAAERESIQAGVRHYIEQWQRYREGLTPV